MRKVENACYSINVRGTEVPKHMLKDLFIHDEEQMSEEWHSGKLMNLKPISNSTMLDPLCIMSSLGGPHNEGNLPPQFTMCVNDNNYYI